MFLAVLLPPAVTLVGLGFRLLEQDRTLQAQREVEDREAAAEAARWRCDSRRRPRNHHLFKDCTGPAGRTYALDTIKTGIAGSRSSTIRRRRESRISRHAG